MHYLENFKDCLIMDRCYLSINRVWSWRRPIRDGQELEQYNNLVGLLNNFVPSDSPDSWTCSLNNSNKFTVASMRCKIEDSMFGSQLETVYWNKYVPIKVNIHNWRLRLDRLPTRCNLDTRGIDLHSTRCPLCDEALETAQHLFVECMVAKDIWIMIKKWWGLGEYPRQLHDLLSWSHSVPLETLTKVCFDVVICTTTWTIWRYRNRVCFDPKPPRKDTLMEEIQILSHSWICHRNKSLNPTWLAWLTNPVSACIKTL